MRLDVSRFPRSPGADVPWSLNIAVEISRVDSHSSWSILAKSANKIKSQYAPELQRCSRSAPRFAGPGNALVS
jgi:hypothetical protein